MNIGLQKKIGENTENGTVSEELFIELVTKKGYKCFISTRDQNMIEHWDVCTVINIDGTPIFDRIDIKSMKESVIDGRIWVELKNVRGNTGWLYSEYMNTIAFELEDCFALVSRSELLKVVERGINLADEEDGELIIYCSKAGLKDYRRYRRIGRNDLIIKVPFKDIEHLIQKKIYKEKII